MLSLLYVVTSHLYLEIWASKSILFYIKTSVKRKIK